MRTRNHNWIDTRTGKAKFGVQVRVGGKWLHVHDNGTPCIYAKESQRDAVRAKLRKMKELAP